MYLQGDFPDPCALYIIPCRRERRWPRRTGRKRSHLLGCSGRPTRRYATSCIVKGKTPGICMNNLVFNESDREFDLRGTVHTAVHDAGDMEYSARQCNERSMGTPRPCRILAQSFTSDVGKSIMCAISTWKYVVRLEFQDDYDWTTRIPRPPTSIQRRHGIHFFGTAQGFDHHWGHGLLYKSKTQFILHKLTVVAERHRSRSRRAPPRAGIQCCHYRAAHPRRRNVRGTAGPKRRHFVLR